MESAARAISMKMGDRLAEHVEVVSAELVVANRLATFEKGKAEKDPKVVILAAKGLCELVGGQELTPEGERFVGRVADGALDFAEKSRGKHLGDGETYHSGLSGDQGRRRKASRVLLTPYEFTV